MRNRSLSRNRLGNARYQCTRQGGSAVASARKHVRRMSHEEDGRIPRRANRKRMRYQSLIEVPRDQGEAWVPRTSRLASPRLALPLILSPGVLTPSSPGRNDVLIGAKINPTAGRVAPNFGPVCRTKEMLVKIKRGGPLQSARNLPADGVSDRERVYLFKLRERENVIVVRSPEKLGSALSLSLSLDKKREEDAFHENTIDVMGGCCGQTFRPNPSGGCKEFGGTRRGGRRFSLSHSPSFSLGFTCRLSFADPDASFFSQFVKKS